MSISWLQPLNFQTGSKQYALKADFLFLLQLQLFKEFTISQSKALSLLSCDIKPLTRYGWIFVRNGYVGKYLIVPCWYANTCHTYFEQNCFSRSSLEISLLHLTYHLDRLRPHIWLVWLSHGLYLAETQSSKYTNHGWFDQLSLMYCWSFFRRTPLHN